LPMAPVERYSIKYGTLACGHTNQGMRCIKASVASTCPLLSEDGVYSLRAVEGRDPLMAKVVREGMQWDVLKWQVRLLYPGSFAVLQASRNTAGHVQRAVHEVQGLFQMHAAWAEQKKRGEPIDFGKIKRAALRTRPPFADDLDQLLVFLATLSGGVDGQYLQELVYFHGSCVTHSLRTMPGNVFAALADIKNIRVAYAILKAAYTCPERFLEGKKCGWIKAGDIAGFAKSKDDSVKCRLKTGEAFLVEVRGLLSAAMAINLAPAAEQPAGSGHPSTGELRESSRILDQADLQVGRYVMNKHDGPKAISNDLNLVGFMVAKAFAGLPRKGRLRPICTLARRRACCPCDGST
jgi:hypothetical protein